MLFLSGSFVFKSFADNMGVSVNATITEVVIDIVTINPNGLKRMPVRPPNIVKGRNTTIIVSVDAITAKLTSLVP